MNNFDSVRPTQHNFIPSNRLTPKKSRRKWKWIVLLVIIIAIAGGVFFVFSKASQIFTGKKNIFSRVGSLIMAQDKPLIGEDQGTVNILIMGIGGAGHDGPYLTDTMIVASINTKTNEVVLTSIPRDFALDFPNIGFNKVNAAYAYAYKNDPNSAGDAALQAAEKITGFNIPYYAVIDFRGFVKAVDDVGGVDVVVDHTFTDATFPNDFPFDTKGYLAPVTFTQGPAHMDGHTALIFARSRHSEDNGEGSDFARSERQKKIIVALKDKISKLNLTNLSTITNLLSDFTDSFRTNMEPYELKRLVDIGLKINSSSIYSFSLEPQGDLICSALVDPATGKRPTTPTPIPPIAPPSPTPTPTGSPTPLTPIPGVNPPPITIPNTGTTTQTPNNPTSTAPVLAYVVEPCDGKTLNDIHNYLIQAPTLAKFKKEAAVVEVQTSLGKPIDPNKFKKLVDIGIKVNYVKFSGKTTFNQTILYDNSKGSKPNSLDYIKNNYTVTTSDINYPNSTADFVIILGKDNSF
jgi:LCP family protein required for cell wall assembly